MPKSSSVAAVLSISSAIYLCHLLQKNILQVLNEDAAQMERWDPSDIISQPFPVQYLQSHIFESILFIMGINFISSLTSSLLQKGKQKGTRFFILHFMLNYIVMIGFLFTLVLVSILLMGGGGISWGDLSSDTSSSDPSSASFSDVSSNSSGGSPKTMTHQLQLTIMASLYLTFMAFGYFHPPSLTSIFSRSIDDNIPYINDTQLSQVPILILIHVLVGTNNVLIKNEKSDDDDDNVNESKGYDNSDTDNKNLEDTKSYHQNEYIGDSNDSDKRDDNENEDDKEIANRYVMYATLFVTIPFQILNILDHGNQIQRWPIPIILGSTIGHCIGCIIAVCGTGASSSTSWYKYEQYVAQDKEKGW